ncbi:MAG: UDP-N-acetylmuramate dehydrogenase, partial [Acidobacteria bacterium]|nr:UDP-N-acetylmuramate dehydrogenase [Acidobacteriota bacterium]
NVPLAPLTTLGVGGPARWFAEIHSVEALRELLRWRGEQSLELFVLGGGSNLVVADAGFAGLVLKIALRGIAFGSYGGRTIATVAAGEPWDGFVAACADRGLAGVECLSGIPGSAGAAPIQNIGAYGQEVAETIVAVDVVDVTTGAQRRLSKSECGFSYRDSMFKREAKGRFIVTAVSFALRDDGMPAVRYPELARELERRGAGDATLAGVRSAVIAIRAAKAMVIDPEVADSRSAGSFFMNPVIEASELSHLEARVGNHAGVEKAAAMPRYHAGEGRVKLPAAWLIEAAGFSKGEARGAARISSRHALALVNGGGATAEDVATLAREIRDRIESLFGVRLVPEPVFVGFSL